MFEVLRYTVYKEWRVDSKYEMDNHVSSTLYSVYYHASHLVLSYLHIQKDCLTYLH